MKRTPWLLAALLLGFGFGCGGKSNNPSDPCGEQPCPAGTHKLNSAKESISQAQLESGEARVFGEGSCQFTCQAISTCPEGMFPVITKECFSCGQIVEGKAVVGECTAVREAAPAPAAGSGGTPPPGAEGDWGEGGWDGGEGEWSEDVEGGMLCCDDYSQPRCELAEPMPFESDCFCPGQGWGFVC